MSTPPTKATLRRQARVARKSAHATVGPAPDSATAALLTALGPATGRVIAGYMPIRTEISPLPAMAALHQIGARICVPVVLGPDQPLVFHRWRPEAAMVPGPFGAMVPAEAHPETPETVIVPLVGFDAALNRLGYGGGFYDRSLAQLRRHAPTRAIGFAYVAQALPPLPVEPTDIALDLIVTEAGPLAPSLPKP